MTLGELLKQKGEQAITISAGASVGEALRLMHQRRVGAVLVPDAGGCPVGIFTERDVVRLYADGDRDFETLVLESRMTCSVVVGRPTDTVDAALTLMTERRFRHLPVVEAGKLLGLVSIGDLVKCKLDETAREAEALREYIHT